MYCVSETNNNKKSRLFRIKSSTDFCCPLGWGLPLPYVVLQFGCRNEDFSPGTSCLWVLFCVMPPYG